MLKDLFKTNLVIIYKNIACENKLDSGFKVSLKK